jgi:pre-mRNA-splicing factor RBM22/SLT11
MKLLDDETKNALREALKGNKADKIKQRIHGEDDLSKKYLSRMKSMNLELSPPEDTSITTLWVGGVQENMSEDDLRDAFYAYGEIRSVFIVRAQKCAFIEYTDRTGAENGAKHLYGALMIRGQPLALNWSRPKAIGTESGSATEESGPMQMLPPPGLESDPVHKYALPHMPLPVGEIPPPQPPPGPPPQQRGKVRGRDGVEAPQPPTKRSNTAPTKTEDALPSVLPDSIHAGAAPAAQSFTHTAGPTRNKPPVRKGPPLPRKPQYPSMSAQRMGSQY